MKSAMEMLRMISSIGFGACYTTGGGFARGEAAVGLRAGGLRGGCRGCEVGGLVGLRAGRLRNGLWLPRVRWWAWGLVRFSYTARPPPPVILPGAAFALLCLAGAFAPCFAVPARAAACCLMEAGFGAVLLRQWI